MVVRSIRPVPDRVKRLVAQGDLLLSAKAADRLVRSGFTIADLEQSILVGSVKKKERDERDRAAFKFTIVGPSLSGRDLYSCGKVVTLTDGKAYFCITAHDADR